jgi:hypothetical protein
MMTGMRSAPLGLHLQYLIRLPTSINFVKVVLQIIGKSLGVTGTFGAIR